MVCLIRRSILVYFIHIYQSILVCIDGWVIFQTLIYFFCIDEIEKAVGCPVGWYELEKKKSAAVSAVIDGLDFDDHSNYPELMNKAIDVVIAMKEVCLPYLEGTKE